MPTEEFDNDEIVLAWPSQIDELHGSQSKIKELEKLLDEVDGDCFWWRREYDSLTQAYWRLSEQLRKVKSENWFLRNQVARENVENQHNRGKLEEGEIPMVLVKRAV